MLDSKLGLGLLLAALIAAGGCSAIADLDDYEEDGTGDGDGDGDSGDGDSGDDGPPDSGAMDAGGGGGDGDTAVADAGDGDGDAAMDAGQDAGTDAGGERPVLGCENPATLCVRLIGFSAHVDELVDIELLTDDHLLRAKALLDPMSDGATTAVVVMPLAIPAQELPAADATAHELHLEINADQNKSGSYDDPPTDHDWDLDLPLDGNLSFTHDINIFEKLDPRGAGFGADLVVELRELDAALTGTMIEVMLIQAATGRTVGLYRLAAYQGADRDLVLPGVVDPSDITYEVQIYIDSDDTRSYGGTDDDDSWIVTQVSSGGDLVITFDDAFRAADETELDYQFAFPN